MAPKMTLYGTDMFKTFNPDPENIILAFRKIQLQGPLYEGGLKTDKMDVLPGRRNARGARIPNT